jgi:hypothetical protein
MKIMKYLAPLSLLFVLCVSLSSPGFARGNINIEDSNGFSPQDVSLNDDAYHGHGLFPFTEWWYFDTMFENGYSAEMSIRIISGFGKWNVFVRLDLYENGTLVTHDSISYTLREIFASSKVPFVEIQGKTILTGSCDDTTGDFVYDVSFDFPGSAAELHFVRCTKGWKGQHQSGDWWAVMLPRAVVTGTISIENTTLGVRGTGYHDHNWDVNGRAMLRFGWFWGKFTSENYIAIWAAILSTRLSLQPIMVVNKNDAGYVSIPSETIWFSANNLRLDHFMFIPYFFDIEAMTGTVFLVVSMEVIDVDYDRFMGFMSYWRYHVHCIGTFMVDGHAQTVDDVFIAEHIRFR